MEFCLYFSGLLLFPFTAAMDIYEYLICHSKQTPDALSHYKWRIKYGWAIEKISVIVYATEMHKDSIKI
jgi:hypothetical protein